MTDDDGKGRYADRLVEEIQRQKRQNPPWDAPIPLGHKPGAVPVFPAHRLPPWLAEFVNALAVTLQVPTDLPAFLVLGALAAAIGGHAEAEVHADWREPLNLYTATAMPPGSRKTPVFKRVVKPLEDAERRLIEKAKPGIIEARIQFNAAKFKADKAQDDVGRAKEEAQDEALHFAKAMKEIAESIEVPHSPRLLVDDATPEALASLLHDHKGRLAMFSDEGEVFPIMAGRYSSGGANLGIYLKAHSGSQIRVDRKGRDAEFVERPALTMALTIQPAMLAKIAGIEGAKGRGLLGRFLWAVPPSNIGYRISRPDPIPEDVAAAYAEGIGALVDEFAQWDEPVPIPFSFEAVAAIVRFQDMIEKRMKPEGDLPHIADWGAKATGHVVRIATLLHLATHTQAWRTPVDGRVAMDACHIGEHYLIPHALVVFEVMADRPELEHARVLWRWAKEREMFTRRDAHRNHQGRFRDVEELQQALDLLEAHGYIRRQPEPATGRGRPASTRYSVNPCRD